MISNRLISFLVFLFVIYSIFKGYYDKTGSIVPKIDLPKLVVESSEFKQQSDWRIKVLKFLSSYNSTSKNCYKGSHQMPAISQVSKAYKVFEINAKGSDIKCGDEIKYSYKLYKLNGDLLLDSSKSEKISHFKLGDENVPYGIYLALLNAKTNSSLTIITPVSYLNSNLVLMPLSEFYPPHLVMPKDELLLLDLDIGQ